MISIISSERLTKYFTVTKSALDLAQTAFAPEQQQEAATVFDMASRYYADAAYFLERGDAVRAFAALNYAHGWLDAGARLGLFLVHDSTLFTVDAK